MDKKALYRTFCQNEPVPLFLKDWWLDAVTEGNEWDAAIHLSGDKVSGIFPYFIKKKMGLQLLTMPKITPFLGPWIKYPSAQKYATRLAYEKDVYTALIQQLPKFQYFKQRFHPHVINWNPFYWQGFRQTTRYTYVLDTQTDTDNLWKNLQPNIRTDIKKATDRFNLSVREDFNPDDFISLNEKTFKRQNKPLPYSPGFIKGVDKACREHNAGKALYAVDSSGQIHAAIYVVWDDSTVYYLISGSDPELRNSGATSFLVWNAIQFARSKSKAFDFEGSMIEPVERFFRAFGGHLVPYFTIYKINSTALRLINAVKVSKVLFC